MMTKCTLRTLPQTATWRSLNTVTNEIPARSAAADTTMIALSAVIVPQIILRSVPSGANSADIAVAAAVAVLSLLAAFLGATWVGRLVPRRLSYQIVASHIGPGMGVVAASARYLCYVIVIVLGVGVATTSLVEVFPALPRGPLLYGLVLALALPVLLRRGRESRLYWVTAALGALAVATVLIWGLVAELAQGSAADAAMAARRQAVLSGRNPGVSHPLMTAVMAAAFPACLLVLLSERVHGGARTRRVRPPWLAARFGGATVAIVVTLYLSILFELPGQRLGVPSLSMAHGLMGGGGYKAVAAGYALLGVSAALAAYARLPFLLSELATDGILPRRLGTRDAIKPRLVIVGLTAVLAAGFAGVLVSSLAGATVFVVCAFLHFGLTCVAMTLRSVGILKESLERAERRSASLTKWAFAAMAGVCGAGIGLTVFIERTWLAVSLVGLAVPALIMLLARRSMGKVARTLAVANLSAGRRLPTRIHGVVLVSVVDDPTLRTVSYARAMRLSSLTALTVDFDPKRTRQLRDDWKEAGLPVDLTVLGTPQGATRGHIVDYVHSLHQMHPGDVVAVFYQRILAAGVWEGYFLRRSMPSVIADLRHEPGVILAEVPYLFHPTEEDE